MLASWAGWIRAALCAATLGVPVSVAGAAHGGAGDYLAARQAVFLGDFEAAALYFGRALRVDPGNPDLLERQILANMSLGDMAKAALAAQTLVDDGHRSQLAQMALIARDAQAENYEAILTAIREQRGLGPLADGLVSAWAQLGEGDMSAAVVGFDEVAKVQGLGPFASYHKALAFASVGDFESAEAIFAANEPGGLGNTRRAIMARLQILGQLDRRDDALDLLDRSFGQTLDPGLQAMKTALEDGTGLPFSHVRSARDGMAEVFYTLSGALLNEENNELTLLYARMATYLRPSHVDAILLSAEILDGLGQFELAEDAYARVAADHPSYHAAELGRAEALRRQGETDEALAVLDALTQSHGDLPSVHSTRGDLLRSEERYAEATQAYTDALDRHDEITERQWFLFYARGITYERQGMWPEAEADFRRALDLNPEQPQVLNYLGYSLVEKQMKLDEALAMIERAVAARPDSGYIVDSLGWVLYRLGRYEEAVVHMERAAELMPIDPIVNDHLGDVYWAVGRKMEATFMWKRALSFVDWEDASEDADPERIRRKIEVGLDQVLAEEGAPPLQQADAGD